MNHREQREPIALSEYDKDICNFLEEARQRITADNYLNYEVVGEFINANPGMKRLVTSFDAMASFVGQYGIIVPEGISKSETLANLRNVVVEDLRVGTTSYCQLAEWRRTKGVYVFDADLLEELEKTDLANVDGIPSEIFGYLPEPSTLFLLGQSFALDSDIYDAAIASTFQESDNDGIERFHLTFINTTDFLVHRYSVEFYFKATYWFSDTVSRTISRTGKEGYTQQDIIPHLKAAINQVLFLCSDKPDLDQEPPVASLPKKIRHGVKAFPANKETVISVGVRLGSAIRRAKNARTMSNHETGMTVIPHVRRAHWHRYRIGKRSEPLHYKLRWISVILVNADQADELLETIRPVEKSQDSKNFV